MAKKKETKKAQVKKILPNINCKCGKEWDRKEVESDQTIHTMQSYSYRFLGSYLRENGFLVLEKVTACPDCRKEK